VPNNYAISPGTVVGNQTVTGVQTVQGDLNVDTATNLPWRFRETTNLMRVGQNIDPVSNVQDTPGAWSWTDEFQVVTPLRSFRRAKPGGASKQLFFSAFELIGGNSAANTGNTTENLMFSTTIQGGVMQALGQIRISIYINVTAQGGVASTIRVKLGGVAVNTSTWATVADRWMELIIQNLGAQNSQKTSGFVLVNNAAVGVAFGSSAVDTTVDQNLNITLQNGATTDSSNIPTVQAMLTGAPNQI